MPSSPLLYDAVVIGLGGVGSMALRALALDPAAAGGRFLGVERFARGHTRGSSHGQSRIFRQAYFEDPRYVSWIAHSLRVFEEMEQQNPGLSLLCRCGTLLLQSCLSSPPSSSVSLKLPPLLQASWESAQVHGIPVEYIDNRDLPYRFPQFHYPTAKQEEVVGLLEPDGGFVRPERAIEIAWQQVGECRHADIDIWEHSWLDKAPVEHFESDGTSRIELRMNNQHGETQAIWTRKLLLSPGPWASTLIPSWAPYLSPTRQLQGWINVVQQPAMATVNAELYEAANMPTWVYSTPCWSLPLYGIPRDTDKPDWYGECIKVGIHGRSVPVTDPTVASPQASEDEILELQTAIPHAIHNRAYSFPHSRQDNKGASSDLRFVKVQPCIYTMTPDTHFLIGVPEPYRNVFAVAGLSGHGYKMTPALGQMMADFALERDLTRWQASFCAPTRLQY